MATTPQQPPTSKDEHQPAGSVKPVPGKEKREQAAKEAAERAKKDDQKAIDQASGKMDDETKEKLLALGADVSRASPAAEQPLPDAVPGLTTTTGAAKSPIDPTTAAVPAEEDSAQAKRMQGFPTMGSGGHGKKEELFKEREGSKGKAA